MKYDVGLQCQWSGKFFGIYFDESAIYTDITDAEDDGTMKLNTWRL